MKVVFMGTPEFSVPSLEMLIESEHEVAAVVTQPDKPFGRGLELKPSPVKELAAARGIYLLQPSSAGDPGFLEELKNLEPDVIVTVAYGKILPCGVLEKPRLACVNVHASLLPRYRGAAPINWVLINGEKETGITTMLMDEGMDTGDILLQRSIEIKSDDNAGTLHDKLAPLGAQVLRETLFLLKDDRLNPLKQDNHQASYAPPLKKEDGRINWTMPAETIINRIRGLNPWPGAFAEYSGNTIKIYFAERLSDKGLPGEILRVEPNRIVVACGSEAIGIKELQTPGKRRMKADEYLRGRKIKPGDMMK